MESNSAMLKFVKGYFTNLFSINGIWGTDEVLQGVEECITSEMNGELLRKFTITEV